MLERDYLRLALASIDASEGSSVAVKGRTLNLDSIAALQVPIPSLLEQHNVVAALLEQLAAVERIQRVLQEQLAEIDKLTATLLRAAFNGEL